MAFFTSSFERRISDLASKSGLKIAELRSGFAELHFTVGSHSQPLFIVPYDNIWEFSCPSVVSCSDPRDFPQVVLAAVLEINAKRKRGFYCIETIGGDKVIEYMHNVIADTLTPAEFSAACWGVVKEVENFEEACRAIFSR